MAGICPSCGENSLSRDEYEHFHGSGQMVCTACGTVAERETLVDDNREAGDSFQPKFGYEMRNYAAKNREPSISNGLRQGFAITRSIAQGLECKPSMTKDAIELFKRTFNHPMFNSRRKVVKRALATCCVYIVCRHQGWPVTVHDVCQYSGCSPYDMEVWKRKLLETFADLAAVRSPDLLQLVDARCEKLGFSETVHQTTVSVVTLCREMWISEGCRSDNVIIPAMFLAWQVETPATRMSKKLRFFCREYKLPYTGRMTKICKDIQSALCNLAKHIPWNVEGTINEKNVMLHLSDVLQFKSSLVAETQRNVLGLLDTEEEDESEISEQLCNHQGTVCDCASVESKCLLPNVKRLNDSSVVETSSCTAKSHVCTAVDNNILSRDICAIIHPDLDSIELSSYDIPDDELHLYIKSK